LLSCNRGWNLRRAATIAFAVSVRETNERGKVRYPYYRISFKAGRPYKCRRTTASPEIPIPEKSTFYVIHPRDELGSRTTSLGRGLEKAFLRYRQFKANEQRKRRGLAPLENSGDGKSSKRVKIADAVANYLAELKETGWGTASRSARERALEDFKASCRKTFVDEIVREDIFLYLSWMKQNLRQSHFRRPNITAWGRLILLNTLLRQYGKARLLLRKEWPLTVKTKPTVYTKQKWAAIMDATIPQESDTDELIARKIEERIRLEFLRFTACLEIEAITAEYGDIDAERCLFQVRRKPHLNWQPKRLVERGIVLPADFVKRLLARRDANNCTGLLFPNTVGTIDDNFIGFLRSAAKRAQIRERVTLHKIRRTTAIDYTSRFGVANCLRLLGCRSTAMTTRYVSTEDMTSPSRRAELEEFFSKLVTR